MKEEEEKMTESEFIARFKSNGFELYHTPSLKPKLDSLETLEQKNRELVEALEKQWISVEDRLPENDKKNDSIYVLVNDTYWGIVVRPYDQYHLCWNTEDDDDYYCDAKGGKVTHWMPLPLSPKELSTHKTPTK